MSSEPSPSPSPTPPPPGHTDRRARDAQLELVRRWQRVLRAEAAQLRAARGSARRAGHAAAPRPAA